MDGPNANSTPEQLAAIEKTWTETYYGEERNPEWEIHESRWLERCADKVTEGKSNLRWFVPLCEKAPAMKWLLDQGHYVVGAELVGKAIEEFFDKYGIKFTKSDVPELKFGCLYQSEDKKIKIFKCNIFDITRELIGGPINAVWDRGSLQDISERDRKRYVEIILSLLAPSGKILAETFEMKDEGTEAATSTASKATSTAGSDEQFHCHSVTAADFEKLYGERCTVEVLSAEHWGDSCEAVADDQPYSSINTVRLITLK